MNKRNLKRIFTLILEFLKLFQRLKELSNNLSFFLILGKLVLIW